MSAEQGPKVLVFSKTDGYRHACIPASINAIKTLGSESSAFTVILDTEDADTIAASNLCQYDVVLFLQTTGEFLNQDQVSALKDFINNGGGFVGVHGAAAGMKSEPWYAELIGAEFTGHPDPQDGVVKVEQVQDSNITVGLPGSWEWHDEWYNFKTNPRDKVKVILSINEGEYEGGKMGQDHPLAWYREFDGGRSFYTSLGHFDEAYEDDDFMLHLLNGIRWAGGATGL